MSEDIETRALERLMVRRGEMPSAAVTIEPPGGGEGPDLAAGPGSGAGQPTGELTNIPRSAVMQAVGQLGSWLQAAAEQLDQV
ncbi:MAG: hypothetical protein IT556_00335, partial [Acetobacteraceae bacterium]|nr:hypothetical protein [Acetobacteraceae bacterium]